MSYAHLFNETQKCGTNRCLREVSAHKWREAAVSRESARPRRSASTTTARTVRCSDEQFFLSLMSYNSHHKSRERRARNSAGAEALAVARRPEKASRDKFSFRSITSSSGAAAVAAVIAAVVVVVVVVVVGVVVVVVAAGAAAVVVTVIVVAAAAVIVVV